MMMELLGNIAKWFCFGIFGLLLLAVLWIAVVLLGERVARGRKRKRFQEHEVFRTTSDGQSAILDPDLETRLKAIGSFVMEVSQGERDIIWKSPEGVACEFAPLELVFTVTPENVGPDETTFAIWERYRSQHDRHVQEFQQRLVKMVCAAEPELSPQQVLAGVQAVSIQIVQDGYGASGTHALRASFRLEWDEEHLYRLEFNSETETFGDWED